MFQKKYILALLASIALTVLAIVLWPSMVAERSETDQGNNSDDKVAQSSGGLARNLEGRDNADAPINNNYADDLALDILVDADTHKALGIQWDNFSIEIDLPNADRTEIRNFVDNMPINGVKLNGQQIDKIKDTFVELAYAFGNEDPSIWFDHLQQSGEVVSEERIQKTRKWLMEKGGLSSSEIKTDGWDLLQQMAGVLGKKSRWRGLSSEGEAQINTFIADGSTAFLPELGGSIQSLRNHRFTLPHLTSPPISIEDVLADQKEILFADIVVFVLHSDESGGRIQPYVVRSWYDSINNQWRPYAIGYFPDRDERFDGLRSLAF